MIWNIILPFMKETMLHFKDKRIDRMRILSITAQKPNSTGSGVYLTELVKEYAEDGHKQAVVAGIYKEDTVEMPDGVSFYPVYFDSEKLPYPIVGMSDEMPYESTRYCDMTQEMTGRFREGFLEVIDQAVEEFQPELILCHHLYFLTAIVRERFPEHTIYGFCHNTDLRQMQKTDFEREFIREHIRKLDHIFVPQRAQEEGVRDIYGIEPENMTRLGMGYNSQIFCATETSRSKQGVQIVFAGKITQKKGVKSLLRALCLLAEREESEAGKEQLTLYLAGSTGNPKEYEEIQSLAGKCPYEVEFLGRLTQPELARVYNQCDIFTLPSFYEGIPLVVIEALACGDRVIMTDLPGLRSGLKKLCRERIYGMYVCPGWNMQMSRRQKNFRHLKKDWQMLWQNHFSRKRQKRRMSAGFHGKESAGRF